MSHAEQTMDFAEAMERFDPVLGFEVHVELNTATKIFSSAPNAFGDEPNTNVTPLDLGLPGTLPVLNREVVEYAIRLGVALDAQVAETCRFARKNYFYPDLPQGYQISQFQQPIVGKGEIVLDMPDGTSRTVGVTRLHLEMDAGKSVHDLHPSRTYVDLNRSGVALMEIVSKPDIRSADEARAYLTKLRTILRYLGTCDGNMDEGSMRADVNVSVRKPGGAFGTRCEIKNVNSIRFVGQAIEAEARRQIAIIEDGGTIDQETRLFDPTKGETRSMRSKEEAMDYRYFPDPDLLPLDLEEAWIADIKASLPELPDAKKARLQSQYGLSAYDAGVLVGEAARANYFEAAAKGRDAKLVANWVTNDLAAKLTAAGLDIEESPIKAGEIAELVALIEEGVISSKIAKDVFERMWAGEGAPREIVEKQGLKQVSDTGALEAIIDDLIAKNPGQAEQVKEKPQAIGWFVGQVMKATGGKANPGAVNQLLKSKLGVD